MSAIITKVTKIASRMKSFRFRTKKSEEEKPKKIASGMMSFPIKTEGNKEDED